MKTSREWINYFSYNASQKRVDWSKQPTITDAQLSIVIRSIQVWQRGETTEGKNLITTSIKYAAKRNDPLYVEAVKLFIKEEQKHGNNLGRYLDMISKPRIKSNWNDILFRKIRSFNSSMEAWTITVLIAESTAQLFYQSLKNATGCALLKEICTDILIDEAAHITFQQEPLSVIFNSKTTIGKAISFQVYRFFHFGIILTVWGAHKKVFKAGGNDFKKYFKKMNVKFDKTIGMLKNEKKGSNLVSSIHSTI